MNNHHHPHSASASRSQRPPTQRQLNYMRDLAMRVGETFVTPRSSAEARREIDRLKGRRPMEFDDRHREDRQVGYDMATRDGGASAQIRDDELTGYGSTAAWTSPRWT